MICTVAPQMTPRRKWRNPNELFAAAIQLRCMGWYAIPQLGGYISLHEWMAKEAERDGLDMTSCGTL